MSRSAGPGATTRRAATRRADRGSTTAELAVGLPVLVFLLLVGISAVSAVTTKLRCVDVARDAVLSASRGEAARTPAPDGFAVTVTADGDLVRARVRASVRPLGRLLPRIAVSADAVAAVEPGVSVA